MSILHHCSQRATDSPYAGDKGFTQASTARLATLALKYRALAGDPATPPALRSYASTTAAELRAELNSRALQEGRAA